ncbi:MAG: hypothetical protein ACM3WV_02990 [Bacillota bacterium]
MDEFFRHESEGECGEDADGAGENGKCEVMPIPFCCYVTVPEGFEPARECERPVILAAIVGNCTFLCDSKKEIEDVKIGTECGNLYCDIEVPKTDLVGSIKVQSALKIKEICGEQYTFVCCCDCVCINETLCYRCPGCEPPSVEDVAIEIDPRSLDACAVDNCNCKTLYKITGKLKVDFSCPRCKQS